MTGGVVSTTSSDRTTRSNWTCPLTVTVPANDHSPRRSQRSSTVLATPYAASRQAGRSTSRIGSSGLGSLSEVSRWRFVPPPKMESGMSTSATRESPRSTSEGPRSNLECVTHVSERVSPISPVHTPSGGGGFLIGIALGSVVALVSATGVAAQTSTEVRQRVLAAYQAGTLADAETIAGSWLAEHPADAEMHFLRDAVRRAPGAFRDPDR